MQQQSKSKQLDWRAAMLSMVVLLTVAASFSAARLQSQESTKVPVKAMSFNIRYGTAEDGENHWRHRRELVFETIERGNYDVVGLQEALPFQLEEVAAALPQYAMHWRTRQVDPNEGEACAILYLEERWEPDRRHRGTFWLSEEKDRAGSKGWDASLPRIVTWTRLTHRETGARVVVFNTHFDHRGEQARKASAELLRTSVAELSEGSPVLILGDFNAGEESPVMQALRVPLTASRALVDSYRLVDPDGPEPYTFNGWNQRSGGSKIDAIYVWSDALVEHASVLRPRFDGRAPSDHDPVDVLLQLPLRVTLLEIVDLGECRSCAGGIERALARVEGVLKAEVDPEKPWIRLTQAPAQPAAEEELREAVRRAGYQAGAIEG